MATNEAYSLTASLERAATTPTLLFFENSDGVQEKRQVRDNQVWDLEVVVTSCTRASKQGSASGATPDSENRQAFARVGKIHPYLRLPLQTSCMQQDRSAHLLLYNPMAEQQPSGAVSAAFPAPPPFYKHFTEQNLAHLKELQNSPPSSDPRTTDPSDDSNKAPSTDAHRLLDLPPELRYLIPPPPPPTGEYRSFGDHYNVPPLPPPRPPQTNTPPPSRSPPRSQPSSRRTSHNSTRPPRPPSTYST